MRIDKSRYESAKKKIAETEASLRKYRETVKTWEDAEKELQPAEGHELKAVIIEDGEVSGMFARKPVPKLKSA